MTSQDSRTCPDCKVEKPLTEFYVDRSRKNGRTCYCKVCMNVRNKRSAAKRDPDERRAMWRRIYARDPDAANARTRAWIAANREEYLAMRKAYRDANKERLSAEYKEWYAANREKQLAAQRRWREAYPDRKRAARDPEKMRADARRRRARLATVEHEDYTDAEIYDRDGGRCRNCGVELSLDPRDFEIDHIVPIALGGPNTRANVQLLCVPCNRKKWTRLEGQIHLPV